MGESGDKAVPLESYLRRRRFRRALWPGLLALLLVLIWADRRGLLWRQDDLSRFDRRWVTVRRVVDAVTLEIDTGDRVILWGISAQSGLRAPNPLERLCLNRRVRLRLDPRATRSDADDLIARVELDDRTFLNETLLKLGAVTPAVPPEHPLAARYLAIAEQARHDKAGLYASEASPDQ